MRRPGVDAIQVEGLVKRYRTGDEALRGVDLSVPAGQQGSRQVRLTVTDPEGNKAQGLLQIEIDTDAQGPELFLRVRRPPLFAELLELEVRASEALREAPELRVNDELIGMEKQSDSTYVGYYEVADVAGEQFLDIAAQGFDRAGNEARLEQSVALRWMATQGGSLGSPDVKVALNVADGAAGPGLFQSRARQPPEQPGASAAPPSRPSA